MRFLVAGPAARCGVALGSALMRHGHAVVLADRFDLGEDAARARAAWKRRPAVTLDPCRPGRALREVMGSIDAAIVTGDPIDEEFDVELSLAVADAAMEAERHPAIVRLTALAPGAGVEDEPVVVRDGRSALRDLPSGIPETRTVRALAEPDRSLRLATAMRDEWCVVLRAPELLDPARLRVDPIDLASRTLLACAGEAARLPAVGLATTVDVVDGDGLARAVARAARRAFTLSGHVLHVSTGEPGRIALGEILEHFAPGRVAERAAAARASFLDGSRSSALLPFPVAASALDAATRWFDRLAGRTPRTPPDLVLA